MSEGWLSLKWPTQGTPWRPNAGPPLCNAPKRHQSTQSELVQQRKMNHLNGHGIYGASLSITICNGSYIFTLVRKQCCVSTRVTTKCMCFKSEIPKCIWVTCSHFSKYSQALPLLNIEHIFLQIMSEIKGRKKPGDEARYLLWPSKLHKCTPDERVWCSATAQPLTSGDFSC